MNIRVNFRNKHSNRSKSPVFKNPKITERCGSNFKNKGLTLLNQMEKEKNISINNKNKFEQKRENGQSLAEIMAEFDRLVGLEKVKKIIKEMHAFKEVQKHRLNQKLVAQPIVMHMIFKGNPGTGKTTVARIIGKYFREAGMLDKGHLVEVERADLVGEYIGHTAQRTREQIKKALGGILFVDEAYSLARGGERDFGKEAIDCLVKGMEDHKEEFILILAGYRDEMKNFISTNPGLHSRFPIHIEFPDYNLKELVAIAKVMLEQKQYILTIDAELKLEKILRRYIFSGQSRNGNARFVRNIIENAIRHQAYRLVKNEEEMNRNNLVKIKAQDLDLEENFSSKENQIISNKQKGTDEFFEEKESVKYFV